MDTEALVAGAGPAGLSAALFLSGHGVRCVAVEKRSGLARIELPARCAPRAARSRSSWWHRTNWSRACSAKTP
ncbi:FAD-dependent monooxygenase [Amycolatopsis minnesotensis]|uniref:FAD-dependent monooxygenase n=1 Tax=Amycolatopsis minnesotensis TaxID=337894 RepID=UPI0031E03AE6